MTRQNNKSSQIKDTLLSPVLPLSVSFVSPPPFLGTCVAPTPLGWLEQVPLALTLSEVFLFAFGLVCVCLCVYSKSTSASTHPLLPHIPADTDGHCYHVQQMSQLIDKLLSRGIHFSLTSTAAACGWGLSQRFEQQSEPIFPPPPDLSLSPLLSLSAPSLCRSPLFTSNPPVSVSVPVARRWLLPSSVSLCHTLAAPTVSLPLLLSPTISCSLSLSFSLPSLLSFTPSLPCFPLHCRSWGSHCGRQISLFAVHTKKGITGWFVGSGLSLHPGKWQLLILSLFAPSFFSLSPSSTIQSLWCMHGSVCVVDAVYIG